VTILRPDPDDRELRPTWAEIDLGAVEHNVARLVAAAAPAALAAVVKADGYGHGAVPVARAALAAGARWLAVALVEEGVELRRAGIDAPVLVLAEPPPAAAPRVVAERLTPVVCRVEVIDALAKAVADAGRPEPLGVHLKVDTGMHRVGVDPAGVLEVARVIAQRPELVLEGVCTHLAVADEPGHPYTDEQLRRFAAALDALRRAGLRPRLTHAANTAALLTQPAARHDLVRAGIGCYGIPPSPGLAAACADLGLRPAMALRSRVSQVRDLPAGTAVSYGLHYRLAAPARVATVPVGYADGVPRNLGLVGGEALVGGRRARIAGAVTMDQCLLDVGDAPVEVGDEVTLLGRQGGEEITAAEWAERLGTIPYEVVCGIGPRVPRRYRHG
jgi:alanine racemase